MAVRTYVDAGLLIQAITGDDMASSIAAAFLYDPLREYVTSDYVKIEVLPHSMFHKNMEEQEFYQDFFDNCQTRVPSSDDLLAFAIEQGGQTGISSMDAIHVACAVVAQADELLTTEKRAKSLHRAAGIKVIAIGKGS